LLGVTDFPPLNRSTKDLVQCGNRFLGAVSGADLWGVLELERPHQPCDPTTIAALGVAPEKFRCGIGSRLVNHAVDAARGASFRVTTGAKNLPAIALYEGCGFAVIDQISAVDGVELIELVYPCL